MKPTKIVVRADVLLKAHVDTFTRKDGAVVQAHDTKVTAAAPKPLHRDIAEMATYSAGRHEEHSATHTDQHSSRSIRVGPKDKAHAMDHARDVFDAHGLKHKGTNLLSGADKFESDTHTGEISHDNNTLHVTVKAKAAAKPAPKKAVVKKESAKPAPFEHAKHADIKEGDVLEDEHGNTHEFSHFERGLGRKLAFMRSGHKYPTKGEHLPGFKKRDPADAPKAPASFGDGAKKK